VLSPSELARAARAPLLVARQAVASPAGSSRLFAIPVQAQGQRSIVIVGSSLRQRDASLGEVRTVLLIGGPVALLLASLLGYAVSALALRNVESMRRRALHVSLGEPGQRLPVPPSNDELARLARTLNEMIARNEVAFQRERAFVADASHELRSPLAILRAELDVALMGDSSQRELRQAMASAGEEADRLSVLTDDLLVLAEADQGNMPIDAAPMDVAKSLQRLAERFGARASEAGAVIETLAPAGLSVRADERRLEQALANLLENSLRHGARRILVRAQLDGARLELHVSDDGPGFPPAFLEVAFERFTRAERARTAPGAGLGLSIVRSIARAHGGEAYIANDDAGGAHVWLSIPDASAPTSRSGPPQSVSKPASVSAP
jgi:signal transduction histidine kinase